MNCRLLSLGRTAVGLCLVGIAILAVPPVSTAAARLPRSILEGVPGLEKRVTYSETKIPLGELVAKVAADTGVPLRAAPDVADEPVAVVVKELPARELLEQLDDLLDYVWSRRPQASGVRRQPPATASPEEKPSLTSDALRLTPAFEIWQDVVGKMREEALRRAIHADVERRFQEEMAICRELAALSQEEIQRLLDSREQWKRELQKLPPEEQQSRLNSPEEKARERRYRLAWGLQSPIERSLAAFMNRLSREQWARLRAGAQLVFSSAPGRGELRLPEDVLRTFRTSRPSVPPPSPDFAAANPEFVEQERRREMEMQERWATAEAYHVTVRFTPYYPKPEWITFNAITSPVRGGQRLGPRYGNPIFVLNISPEDWEPLELEDPQRAALLGRDPLLGLKKPFQSDVKRRLAAASRVTLREFLTLQDLLPDLARTYDVHFIADAYWGAPGLDYVLPGAEPIALFALLDRLTRGSYTWDWAGERRGTAHPPSVGTRVVRPVPGSGRGAMIRVRSRAWFLHRRTEIPLRHVRRWIEICDRLGALPFEEYVSMASALTDTQITALDGLFAVPLLPPPLRDLQPVDTGKHLLRLYATLLPAQREALRQGKELPLSQLPARVHPLALATLNRIGRMRYPLMDAAEWMSGSLALTTEPRVRIREERGGLVSFRTEPVPEAGPPASAAPPAAAPGTSVPSATTRRYPVRHLKLQIRYGTEQPASVELIVAPSPAVK